MEVLIKVNTMNIKGVIDDSEVVINLVTHFKIDRGFFGIQLLYKLQQDSGG